MTRIPVLPWGRKWYRTPYVMRWPLGYWDRLPDHWAGVYESVWSDCDPLSVLRG